MPRSPPSTPASRSTPASSTSPRAPPCRPAAETVPLPTPANERSIGFLFDEYLKANADKLAPKTLKDYRLKIGTTLAAIAELRGKTLASIRFLDITYLKEPAEGSGLPFQLLDAYDHLLATKGANMARASLTATSAWLSWVKFKKRLLAGPNPCLSIKCETVDGRRP